MKALVLCILLQLSAAYLYAASGSGLQPVRRAPHMRPSLSVLDSLPTAIIEVTRKDGLLEEKDVEIWFSKGNLINRRFSASPCIEVAKLVDSTGHSEKALTADQVFRIHTKCIPETKGEWRLIYILKVYNQNPHAEKELKNLIKLRKEFRGLPRRSRFKYPKIMFPEKIYKYYVPELDSPRFMSLVHGAKGKSIFSLFSELYKSSQNLKSNLKENLESTRPNLLKYVHKKKAEAEIFNTRRKALLRAAQTLGENLANLHTKYLSKKSCTPDEKGKTSMFACKTLGHGDPNIRNIFWDGKEISLIDIETMAAGPQSGAMVEDFSVLFGTLYNMAGSPSRTTDNPTYEQALEGFWEAFQTAYLIQYKKKVHPQHFRDLITFIKRFGWGAGAMKTRVDNHPSALDVWKRSMERLS